MVEGGKLHLDELDLDKLDDEQQICMFVQLDVERPRILTFGPTLEQLYYQYYSEFELEKLNRNNTRGFIDEIQRRCVLPSEHGWNASIHHPLHYITLDPGDIWFFNSQWITHEVVFGTKMQCCSVDIKIESLLRPDLCIDQRIKKFNII